MSVTPVSRANAPWLMLRRPEATRWGVVLRYCRRRKKGREISRFARSRFSNESHFPLWTSASVSKRGEEKGLGLMTNSPIFFAE